jgi:Holliday junction DNA helicase RuvA
MIASLRGRLAALEAGGCIVEVGGVGYQVLVSAHTLRALPAPGGEVFLLTHQHVREDALQLFGFAEDEERRLFELLIGVSGVGPKVALAVLSGLEPRALARAIREENLAALTAVPGIGRKTAERLVVELRDKLELPAAPVGVGVLPRADRFEDAVAGLVHLGYSRAQAVEAVRRASDGAEGLTLEELVRISLARLSRAAVGAP